MKHMAPRPLPKSWSSPSPTNHSTLQWHITMAPSNGTTSTPLKLVVTFPLQPWHTTMAPCNGTTSTPPCNGTLVPRPICQNGSSPSPLLEVRTPIAISIWGKTGQTFRCRSPLHNRSQAVYSIQYLLSCPHAHLSSSLCVSKFGTPQKFCKSLHPICIGSMYGIFIFTYI